MRASYGLVQQHLTHVLADELSALKDYAALARAIDNGDEAAAARHATVIVSRGSREVARVLEVIERDTEAAR